MWALGVFKFSYYFFWQGLIFIFTCSPKKTPPHTVSFPTSSEIQTESRLDKREGMCNFIFCRCCCSFESCSSPNWSREKVVVFNICGWWQAFCPFSILFWISVLFWIYKRLFENWKAAIPRFLHPLILVSYSSFWNDKTHFIIMSSSSPSESHWRGETLTNVVM